jgi:hypothetical protein
MSDHVVMAVRSCPSTERQPEITDTPAAGYPFTESDPHVVEAWASDAVSNPCRSARSVTKRYPGSPS